MPILHELLNIYRQAHLQEYLRPRRIRMESTLAAKNVSAEGDLTISKKAAKKAEKNAAKEAKKAAVQLDQSSQIAKNKLAQNFEDDFFGYLPMVQSTFRSKRLWNNLKDINDTSQKCWFRCRLHESRCKGAIGFLVLRQQFETIQAVIDSKHPDLGRDAIKWAGSLPLESIVDILGVVSRPETPISATTHQWAEIKVDKIFCISKAIAELPFQLKDANRKDNDESENVIRVGQDIRLDNRVLDLRTNANLAIFKLQSEICRLFRESVHCHGFTEIHSPKLMGGSAEGGASVFSLKYFDSPACLAQSPQLHKQMSVCADLERVFEIGPVFRAEESNTYRHLCEFTGVDIEMLIKEHYEEVLDVIEPVFKAIFKGLNEQCQNLIERVHAQYPAASFIWTEEVPRIEFLEAAKMLRDAGCPDVPEDASNFDFSTEQERMLGRLVKEKYQTDFFVVVRYPLSRRPFYTMPSADDAALSNSFDVFMRGEEIISGAQRIHDYDLLKSRAEAHNIPLNSIAAYLNAFKLGASPHGGVGIGLERVEMLFLGLNNIRKTSLFPRDPKRISP